jgi:hypothetical protein
MYLTTRGQEEPTQQVLSGYKDSIYTNLLAYKKHLNLMKGKLIMKNNFQQPAQVELDEQELEMITGGCSHKKHEKHLPPPPPSHHGKPPVHHPGQPPVPYPGQSGFPNGFGGHNGKC